MVNVWDGRNTSAAKMSKTNHTAAVKVHSTSATLYQRQLLIQSVWNLLGARLVSLDSQSTGLRRWIFR